MLKEIVIIDYNKPLAERAKSRKVVGPYRWQPAKPNTGRGFYQASHGLAVDQRGSTFDLRLEYASDLVGRSGRSGSYWADDTEFQPIVARLPHSRGFLAGWTTGESMAASLDATIYSDAEEAARAAYDDAQQAAERELDYQESQNAECAECGSPHWDCSCEHGSIQEEG